MKSNKEQVREELEEVFVVLFGEDALEDLRITIDETTGDISFQGVVNGKAFFKEELED